MDSQEIIRFVRSGLAGRDGVARVLFADPRLRKGIKKSVGDQQKSEEELNEIFNYTLVQFIKNVLRDEQFILPTDLYSYLFEIARNVNLNIQGEKAKLVDLNISLFQSTMDEIENQTLSPDETFELELLDEIKNINIVSKNSNRSTYQGNHVLFYVLCVVVIGLFVTYYIFDPFDLMNE